MRDYDGLLNALLDDLGFGDMPDSHVYSDMDPVYCAKTALANSFYKKLCPNGNTRSADSAALEKFLAINARLQTEPWDFIAENEAQSHCYDYFRNGLAELLKPLIRFPEPEGHWESEVDPLDNTRCVDKWVESIDECECPIEDAYNLDFIRENMITGPGAAQKADSTSMVHKLFLGEMSYTNDWLISLYRSALATTGSWANAEMARFKEFGFTKVRGGKLFFAPKNSEISRTCCTESNLGMLIQKSAGAFIETRLLQCFGISLATQPQINREMARQGSINGSIGTIDLVSASDCIGLQPFLRYFPDGHLKTVMLASRSETAILPDGREVELRMVSTMGNGFTFPLQTAIFACMVRACYDVMGIPHDLQGRRTYGVFGDDICVRKEAYDFVCLMLGKLGFEVNVKKSFNSGAFRESCGCDYVSGYNVRGVYCTSLETPQEIYSTMNRLIYWGAKHNVRLLQTLHLLRSWLGVKLILVPPSESDDAGLHVPSSLMPSTKVNNSYWYKYRCYVRRTKKVDLAEPDSMPDAFNQEAVAVGFLSGHFRRREHVLSSTDNLNPWSNSEGWGFSVSIRDKIGARARYKVVTKTLPWWDYQRNPKDSDNLPWEAEGRQVLTDLNLVRWQADVVAVLS